MNTVRMGEKINDSATVPILLDISYYLMYHINLDNQFSDIYLFVPSITHDRWHLELGNLDSRFSMRFSVILIADRGVDPLEA